MTTRSIEGGPDGEKRPRLRVELRQESVAADEDVVHLFMKYSRALKVFIHSVVRNEHVAEDIAQQTYLKMLSVRREGQVANPQAYLFRTAHNLSIDFMRRQNLRIVDETVMLDGRNPPSSEPTPEEVLSYRQTERRFQEALERLPKKTRQVFYLRRYNGLPIAEISRTLQVSERMVYKHLQKALKHLWKFLKTPSND